MEAPDKCSIERTLNNTATREEARKVIRWFSTPKGSAYLSRRMDEDATKILPETEGLYVEHPIPSVDMYDFIMTRIHWQRKKRIIFRVAALLIPFLFLAGQFWYIEKRIDLFDNSGYEEVYVPKGERMQVVFQDGSRASLNSESRIRYPRKFGFSERKVELEGEAFFEVTPNKNRPFIVDLKGIDIKVLGTTFDAKAYPADPEIFITLETGNIELNYFAQTLAYLKPGQKASYNKLTKICKISTHENVEKHSAWKENLIIFENTSLFEVTQVLSRWFNVDFMITDSSALHYNYTLTSSPKDIHQILMELEKIAPIQFTEKDSVIFVKTK